MDLNKKLASLAEISKSQIAKILNSVPGEKDLTLEDSIIRPLERICGVSWLRGNGVEKIFKLEPSVRGHQRTQFFMIYAKMSTFKRVVEMIQAQLDQENPVSDKYHVICIPRYLYAFENLLEGLGLFCPVVKLYSLQWFPLHLDTNLCSLEIPDMYSSLFIKQDISLLPAYAKSIWHLSAVFGKPKFTLALGQYSNMVLKQLANCTDDGNAGDFGGLIIMDRTMDYPSALLTPATYTALLKEVFKMHCGVCDIEAIPTEASNAANSSNLPLNSEKDSVYGQIKDKYFTEVTDHLSKLTKELRVEGEVSKEMALDQIKVYVKTQLNAARSKKRNVTNHLIAAEAIIKHLAKKFEQQIEVERNMLQNKGRSMNLNFLEQILFTEHDKYSSLLLICLMAVTQNLSESESRNILNKYFLEFGYECGYLYRNLVNAGIIAEVSENTITSLTTKIKMPLLTSSTFYANANKMKQILADPAKVDLKAPKCCSYVFGGAYIPLLVQIISSIVCATPIDQVKSRLSGFGELEIQTGNAYPLLKRSVLVYVVGGVTYSEVAACKLLERLLDAEIVVVSDKCISGKDIAEALLTLL